MYLYIYFKKYRLRYESIYYVSKINMLKSYVVCFSHYQYATDYRRNVFLSGASLSLQWEGEYYEKIFLCYSSLSCAK